MHDFDYQTPTEAFIKKIFDFPILYMILVGFVLSIGLVLLYSIGSSQGTPNKWIDSQILFIVLGLISMLVVAYMPPHWLRLLAWPAWLLNVILLILVLAIGSEAGGATRWLDFKFFRVQPSEVAKYTTVLLLASASQSLNFYKSVNILYWLKYIFAVFLLVALTFLQPDLGTSLLIMFVAIIMLFAAGLHWLWYIAGIILSPFIVMFAWLFLLKDYMKKRVLTLISPSNDLKGDGFHIFQSKIGLGSGGWDGKGLMNSTQAKGKFLPESHTDFIFTVFGEEFGYRGVMVLLFLYIAIILYGYLIALMCKSRFNMLLAFGASTNLFAYVFVNIGMVSGILPVVGVPLALVSKGGSSMVMILIGVGFVMHAYLNRHFDYNKNLNW